MPAALHAVSATDPDPNNLRTLAGRIVQWLVRESPAGIGNERSLPSDAAARPAMSVRPNPARGAREITLDFPSEGPARLEVFDAAGRRVARIFDGSLPAGHHAWIWRSPAPGLYLLRFGTPVGQTSVTVIAIE